MRIIGIDYGLKRTGTAIWDSEVNLTLPMTVIEEKDIEKLVKAVADVAFFEKSDLIVVGHPKALNNDATGEQVVATEKFVELLRGDTTIPIEIEDERLSTDVAKRLQWQAGKKQAAAVDALAAAAILESYVQRKKLAEK